jgi:hypothetical protein
VTILSIQSFAQRKKVEYLDTLAHRADFMTFISIYNTGKYKWAYDNSNEKIRYIKWERYNLLEIDSILRKTKSKVLIQ